MPPKKLLPITQCILPSVPVNFLEKQRIKKGKRDHNVNTKTVGTTMTSFTTYKDLYRIGLFIYIPSLGILN